MVRFPAATVYTLKCPWARYLTDTEPIGRHQCVSLYESLPMSRSAPGMLASVTSV